ncbi:MAG TPA: sigma-70 family RNA polymerase sigma factor [Mycobacteriales bacterium]|nr:sigma-70 family RNA polymerase sigma factor [Mycobacteriales bacterium]
MGTHAGVDVDGGRLDANDVARALEAHRRELTGYCYRMLGSTFEAEDAVQETMLRAWRGSERFEGRSPLRAWLYRIATNVCFDALRDSQRRPMDLGPNGSAERAAGPPGARVRVDPAGARRPGAAGRRRPGRAGDASRVGPAGVRRRPPAPATPPGGAPC